MILTDTRRKKDSGKKRGISSLKTRFKERISSDSKTLFDYWADACKEEWLDRVEAGDSVATFYDIPNPA